MFHFLEVNKFLYKHWLVWVALTHLFKTVIGGEKQEAYLLELHI